MFPTPGGTLAVTAQPVRNQRGQPAAERRALRGVPLGDILGLPAMAQARVVAGEKGLSRVVRSVNVMEVPDIFDWVQPDELLLTTAYPLRDDPNALAELVPRLAERGLAGIAIKPTRYIGAIPPAMAAEAERLDFPLIELPPPTSFNEVIGAVLGVILDVQSTRLQRAAEIHERFMNIVLVGGGLRQIAEALAEAIGLPVAILDPQGGVLGQSADFGSAPAVTQDAPGDQIRKEIRVGAEYHGEIVGLGRAASLGDDELEALDYAATVAALRLVQARAVADADRRFHAICLDELVTGHVADRATLMERAAAFGWDLATPQAVLVAEIERLGELPFGRLAGSPEEIAATHRLADAARLTLGQHAIVWERTAGVAALIADAPRGRDTARQAGNDLLAEAARRLPGATVDIGIGSARQDPLQLDGSFREARTSIAVARWSRGHGAVSLFEDLALDRLLFNAPNAERAAFVDATIGPLIRYDARHKTSLVETLDVYLATRNAADAARRLYVHYNTLANRLERIAVIVGPFVDDADRCLTLALAIRLKRSPAV